jgi:hypothetical protein
MTFSTSSLALLDRDFTEFNDGAGDDSEALKAIFAAAR